MKKQKGLNTLPELDVEYTFNVLPASRLTKVNSNVYRWYGQYDKQGHLLMFDVKNGDYFTLPVDRFSYLLNNELICSKKVPPKLETEEQLSIFDVNPLFDNEGGNYESNVRART